MESFLHEQDSFVDRVDNGFGTEVAKLCDEEGACVFTFPVAWSDEQIRLALQFANKTYQLGVERGQGRKAAEIRACLGIV